MTYEEGRGSLMHKYLVIERYTDEHDIFVGCNHHVIDADSPEEALSIRAYEHFDYGAGRDALDRGVAAEMYDVDCIGVYEVVDGNNLLEGVVSHAD